MLDTSSITEHMEIIGSCGNHVGTVDHLDGDRIKLAKGDTADGRHKWLALSEVEKVEGGKVVAKQNHVKTLSILASA